MASKLADDPFKRRQKLKSSKSPLFLTESKLNHLSLLANVSDCDDSDKSKLEKRKKEREACKWLTEAFAKRDEAGSELRNRQYEKDVLCARRELDREAKMEIRRNFVLDEAYQKVFEETDRVKYFKAAKNFCEMMKEREDQVAAKMSQQNNLAEYEAQFLLGVLRDIDKHKDEERAKDQVIETNKKKNAANWSKQHHEMLQKKKNEKLESLRDGFLIKDEVEKEKEKLKEKKEKEKEEVKNYKRNLDHQIEDKLLLLEMGQRLDDAEDERAKLFNEAKREMELEFKKLASKRDKQKSDKRQHVADELMDNRSDLEQKEAAAVEKAALQAEEKAKAESAKREYQLAEAQKAIDEYYRKEMALKKEKKYKEKLENLRDKRRIDDLVDSMKAVEVAKLQKQDRLEKEAQHVQTHQIKDRKVKDKAKEIEALEDYLLQMKDLEEEEKIFQKYAQQVIKECEARGVDTYAMKKAALPGVECGKGPLFDKRGNIRPRYYAATWNPEDLTHMNRKGDLSNTKARLGFLL